MPQQSHAIKKELDRIKTYVERIKTIESKDVAKPQVDTSTVKRMIAHHIEANPVNVGDIPKKKKQKFIS